MRDEKVVRALHEPYDALLVNEQVTYPRFMASTHVKILEVFPFHEPTKGPPGFGLRQSSGAFRSGLGAQKRQRTAAVQDAIATDAPSSAVQGPNACGKTKADCPQAVLNIGGFLLLPFVRLPRYRGSGFSPLQQRRAR